MSGDTSTATLPGHDDAAGDSAISPRPDALALFNPALVLAPVPGVRDLDPERITSLHDRMGADPESLSPYHHVKQGLPPTIVFHGKADTTVPYVTAEIFAKKAMAAGNRCELIGYDGQSHGFFNYGRGDGSAYLDTVRRMDEFFGSLGWISGKPKIGTSE